MSDKWILLTEFSSTIEAEFAAARLRDAGLHVMTNSPAAGIFGAGFSGSLLHGVRLLVPSSELNAAGKCSTWICRPDSYRFRVRDRGLSYKMGLIGIFLLVSAVMVLFPAISQIRMGESTLKHVWGYLIVALGLVLAAFADSRMGADYKTTLAVAGVALALVGLLVQSSLPRPPAQEDHDH